MKADTVARMAIKNKMAYIFYRLSFGKLRMCYAELKENLDATPSFLCVHVFLASHLIPTDKKKILKTQAGRLLSFS